MSAGGTSRPSMAVVTAVAKREGIDPGELRPPLWESIDPEALDRLFHDAQRDVTVEFEYRSYTVRIDETGAVTLREPDAVRGPESTK